MHGALWYEPHSLTPPVAEGSFDWFLMVVALWPVGDCLTEPL
jgi:hypothetical protein